MPPGVVPERRRYGREQRQEARPDTLFSVNGNEGRIAVELANAVGNTLQHFHSTPSSHVPRTNPSVEPM